MTQPLNDLLEKKRIVVLGASGFLGSAMTRYLADLGHDVVAYWRNPDSELLRHPRVSSVIGDLRDTWILADAISGADVVYHFASATHPSRFYTNPSAEYWEALQPLLVLMETASRVGVKKVVFPSSGGTVYAESSNARTEESPLDPRSPYAVLKLTAEQLLMHSSRLKQFNVDIYRVGNPYGPGQKPRPGQGVLPHWIDALCNNAPLIVFGDPGSTRDYIFIEDLCRLMALSCERPDESGIFNVATGVATSLQELLELVTDGYDKKPEIIYQKGRPSDIRSIVLSPEKILRKVPNFKFTNIADGVRAMMNKKFPLG